MLTEAPRARKLSHPALRHLLEEVGQLPGVEFGGRRGAVTARVLARRDQQQARVLYALARRPGAARLGRIAPVVGQGYRQYRAVEFLDVPRRSVGARAY